MPVISMWRAYKIPLPALVSADPYGTLCTPLLDREHAEDAAHAMMQQARAGRRPCADPARRRRSTAPPCKAFREVLRRDGLRPRLLQSHLRASARRHARRRRTVARGARRQETERAAPPAQPPRRARRRAVSTIARTPQEVAAAVETFLTLEASGWKAKRGTALVQDDGDAAFIRRATVGAGRSRPMRDRDTARRRDAGCRRRRAAAPRPRVLLQARRRRAFRKIFAGRAADAGPDPASLRRSRDCIGRFHRQRRPSHDQPDLARTACDRRRADPAAPARSLGAADPERLDAAQADPRAGAPRRSFHPATARKIVRRNPHEHAPRQSRP